MWLSITFLCVVSIILFIFQKPARRYTTIGLYYKKVRIELSAVKYRRDVYNRVTRGEIVTIKQDPLKEYTGNAIGAYTQNGKLLGYIPRHQRKLINTFRENPESLAMIYRKFNRGAHFRILIDVFLPLDQHRITLAKAPTLPSKET
jgi:hypothetical protein